jgi:hypothetical protein
LIVSKEDGSTKGSRREGEGRKQQPGNRKQETDMRRIAAVVCVAVALGLFVAEPLYAGRGGGRSGGGRSGGGRGASSFRGSGGRSSGGRSSGGRSSGGRGGSFRKGGSGRSGRSGRGTSFAKKGGKSASAGRRSGGKGTSFAKKGGSGGARKGGAGKGTGFAKKGGSKGGGRKGTSGAKKGGGKGGLKKGTGGKGKGGLGKKGDPTKKGTAKKTSPGSRLNKSISGRMNKLDPGRRGRAERARTSARNRLRSSRRPAGLRGKAGKVRVRAPAGRGRSNLARFNSLKGLGRSKDPNVRNIRTRLLNNRRLTVSQRRWAWLRTNSLLRGNRRNPLALALWAALRADWRRGWLGVPVGAYLADGECGCIAVDPSGTEDDPGELTGEGCSIEAPPGIDPCGAAAVFPEDEEDASGQGIVCGLDPESVDPDPEPGQNGQEEDEEPGDELAQDPMQQVGKADPTFDAAPVDSVWQNTRGLRVGNGTKEKVKVFVEYETQNDQGQTQWYPQNGQARKGLQFDLAPGEVSDLKDGDWQINARRVRVWAQGADGKRWVRFKDKELDLVPEKDGKGNHGYASPQKQKMVVAFR